MVYLPHRLKKVRAIFSVASKSPRGHTCPPPYTTKSRTNAKFEQVAYVVVSTLCPSPSRSGRMPFTAGLVQLSRTAHILAVLSAER